MKTVDDYKCTAKKPNDPGGSQRWASFRASRKVYRFSGYQQGRKNKGQKDRSSCPAV